MSRSNWKPILNKKFNSEKKKIKTYSRNTIIVPKNIGDIINIYNGIRFFEINITKSMVGHKLGEFAPSRIKPTHKKKKK